MNPLFFDEKSLKYYMVSKEVQCYYCKKMVTNSFVLHMIHNKLMNKSVSYCQSCVKRIKLRDYDEVKFVNLTDNILRSFKQVSSLPPELTKTNVSVFEVATSNKGISADCSKVSIMDRTRLAIKEQIGEIEFKENG